MLKQIATLSLAGLLSLTLISCGEEETNPTSAGGGGGGGATWDADLNGTWDYYGTGDMADLSGEPMTAGYFEISDGSWKTQGTEMFSAEVGSYYAKDGVIGYEYSGTETPMWSYLVEDGVLYWDGSRQDGTVDKSSSSTTVFKKQ